MKKCPARCVTQPARRWRSPSKKRLLLYLPLRCSMLDVRCSMFISSPHSTVTHLASFSLTCFVFTYLKQRGAICSYPLHTLSQTDQWAAWGAEVGSRCGTDGSLAHSSTSEQMSVPLKRYLLTPSDSHLPKREVRPSTPATMISASLAPGPTPVMSTFTLPSAVL